MNVLVHDTGHARICDFGLVRILSDDAVRLNTTTKHTGTARYLAYELVVDEKPLPTEASDVHAIGCIGLDVSSHILDFEVSFEEFLFQFVFLTSSYADCKTHAQLFMTIVKKKPPSSRIPISSEPSEPIVRLWGMSNASWDILPGRRPSVSKLEEFVMDGRVEPAAALTSLEGQAYRDAHLNWLTGQGPGL
jgi:serine/threonine protein kinase